MWFVHRPHRRSITSTCILNSSSIMFFASVLVLLHVGQIVAQRTSLFFNGFGC